VVVSLIIAIASFAGAKIARLDGSIAVIATGSTYTRVMLGGVASIFLLF
jgi:hypothetical protein